MSLFEKATRIKLRFPSVVGNLTTEQLWDLPLTTSSEKRPSLKAIAISLQKQLGEQTSGLDFFDSNDDKDELVELQFEIVKYIVTTRISENKAKSEEKVKQTEKEKIASIIAEKEAEKLKDMSIEDLKKLMGE